MPKRGSRAETLRLYRLCVEQQGNACCRICGAPPPVWPARHTVDHINGTREDSRPRNIRLACRSCNGRLGNLKLHHPDLYRRIRGSDDRIRAHYGLKKFSVELGGPESHNGHAEGGESGGAWGDIYPSGTRTYPDAYHQWPVVPGDKAFYDEMLRSFWAISMEYLKEVGGRASAKEVREITAIRMFRRRGIIIKKDTLLFYMELSCCAEGPFEIPDDDPTAAMIRVAEDG